MLKKLLVLSLISVALVGCGNSKEAVYDKCLTQANDTFEKDKFLGKLLFLNGCMSERGYKRIESDKCLGNLSSECYNK